MIEGGTALGRNGWFPRVIRSKKECIKSCETCFANTLNLNDKGPGLKWVCFPKPYSPLANWPWLRISPQSSLYVIYCLILTAWQWLMSFTCISVQNEPNKSPLRKRLLVLLLWEVGHLSSPSRSCPSRLILIHSGGGGKGGPVGRASPKLWKLLPFLSNGLFVILQHNFALTVFSLCISFLVVFLITANISNCFKWTLLYNNNIWCFISFLIHMIHATITHGFLFLHFPPNPDIFSYKFSPFLAHSGVSLS